MRYHIRKITLSIALLALLAGAVRITTAWPGGDGESTRSTYERHLYSVQPISFTSGEESVRALILFTCTPHGLVTRLLISGEQVAPLVLTHTLVPRTGTNSFRFLDDETGWWLVVAFDDAKPAPNLGSLIEAIKAVEPGTPIQTTIMSRGGVEYAGVVESPGTPMEIAPFVKEAVTEGLCEKLQAEVPEHLWSSAQRLGTLPDRAMSVPGWHWVVDLLVACAPDAGLVLPPHSWEVETTVPKPERSVVDPSLLALTSRFQSLDTTEPLSKREIATLLGVRETELE